MDTIMKKNLLKITAIMIFTILFSSCDNNNAIINETDSSEYINKTISFNISYPKDNTNKITYSSNQEDDSNIKSLYLIIFNSDGSYLKKMEVTNYLIQQNATNIGEIKFKYNFHQYKGHIYIDDLKLEKAKCQFLFVANHKIASTFSQDHLYEQYISDNLSSSNINKNGLPMSGYALKDGNQTIDFTQDIESIDVILTRAVSRVDIENHSSNLIITKTSLNNTADKVWLYNYEKNDEDLVSTKIESLSQENNIFYFYPNKYSNSNDAPFLHLEGKYKGENIELDVPFYKDNNTKDCELKCTPTYYSLHRNSKYKVVLGESETEAKIETNITVIPWGINNIDEIIDTNIFN